MITIVCITIILATFFLALFTVPAFQNLLNAAAEKIMISVNKEKKLENCRRCTEIWTTLDNVVLPLLRQVLKKTDLEIYGLDWRCSECVLQVLAPVRIDEATRLELQNILIRRFSQTFNIPPTEIDQGRTVNVTLERIQVNIKMLYQIYYKYNKR